MKNYILTSLLSFLFITVSGQAELKPQFDKAKSYLQAENFKNAEKEFTSVLEKATDARLKKMAFIYRGFANNGLEKFTAAIADFDNAVALDPEDLATYIDRGQSKIYANDFPAAIKDFEFVLSKDSVNKMGQNALYWLARVAHHEKEFALSISYYDRLIQLDQADPELYFNRGAAKDMMMNSQGSIKDYDKAIELKPDYREAYANRGVARINLLTTKGTILPSKDQTKDACADLQRAKQLGDNAVDDMIYIHCRK
ncbi:MAG TPA: tetratricopeptide repeat protein [Chitinophagaceae bacterium]|jgi:tetratricopeptide (TPR) repeat protein|nr:tetratricopeptide repeat protein [Chitinophagaceae bacterium]